MTKSTSYAEVSPAKMLAAPGLEKALKIAMGKLLAADYGGNTQGSLANLDQHGSWQKMFEGYCQPLLISDQEATSELFSGTWPTWGMMRSGRVTALKPLARRTKGKESLSWRTPQAHNGQQGSKSKELYEKCLKTGQSMITLTDQVKHECNWPTPLAGEWNDSGNIERLAEYADTKQLNLKRLVAKLTVQNWATPQASDFVGGARTAIDSNQKCLGRDLKEINLNGQLNADWVELLMNLPIGWTDTDKSNEDLDEWPGWPAPMNAGENWITPQANASTQGMEGLLAREKRNGMHATRNLTAQIEVSTTGQYPYEPPRVVEGQKNRAKRLKCLGNGCCPAQVYPIFKAIMEAEK